MAITNNPYDSTVDKLIGDAYQAVKRVAVDIAYIKHVSYHLKDVHDVAGNLEVIKELLEVLQIKGNQLLADYVKVTPEPTGLDGGSLQDVLQSLDLRLQVLENK